MHPARLAFATHRSYHRPERPQSGARRSELRGRRGGGSRMVCADEPRQALRPREEVEEGKPRREARPLPGRRRQGGRGGVPHAHACSPILLKLVLSHLAAGTGLAGANIRERTLRLLLACSSSNLTAASCATRSERSSSSARWGVFAGVGVGASNCWGSKGARQLVRSFFATIHHLISLA